MKNDARLSRLATDLLGKELVTIDLPTAEVELNTTAAIVMAIAGQGRKRKARRIAFAVSAAAAGVLLAVGARAWIHRSNAVAIAAPAATVAAQVTVTGHAVAGGVVLLHDGHEASLEGGSAIFAGDRVVASADGRAAVSLSTGSHLIVESGADMSVVEQDASQIFDLRSGSIRADVAKLGANERFVIRTPDAEVEVRGTSFRVAVVPSDACSAGTLTRVYVSEGTVVVRARGNESRVPAGTSWPPECAARAQEAPAATATAMTMTQAPPSVANPSSNHAAPATTRPTSASELAAQNQLYGEATAAKRRGDVTGA
ncbi:MAG: FecR domain-containing protein, partial [Polyangiaceae bacterium]